MMHKKSPIKPAYRLMHMPMSIDPRRSFRLVGHVLNMIKDVETTTIVVKHEDQLKYEDNITEFPVFFKIPERKIYVDMNIKAGDLVVIEGELIFDKEIKLEGNYIMGFRGTTDIYDEPQPIYINPDDVPDSKQIAY